MILEFCGGEEEKFWKYDGSKIGEIIGVRWGIKVEIIGVHWENKGNFGIMVGKNRENYEMKESKNYRKLVGKIWRSSGENDL